MNFLLVAINAKYIHSNPAVYSLREYADRVYPGVTSIYETTINTPLHTILSTICDQQPDVIGISTYIWNIDAVRKLLLDLPKVLPDTDIWLGGPEVSYHYENIFEQYKNVRGIFVGEGDRLLVYFNGWSGTAEDSRNGALAWIPAGQHNDGLGAYLLNVSALITSEEANNNPDTDWEPIPRTKRTNDQVIKYGYAKAADNYSYGSACVSGKCENIPLACSWIDWCFSDFGSDFVSWDTGMRQLACYDVFFVKDYKGEYEWPDAVTFENEEKEETTALFADLNTYFSENYNAFIDGAKPMSEWDSYIQGLYDFGYERIKEIYQAAYDRYEARGL